MARPVRTHVFRGKRYRIDLVPPCKIANDFGRCSPPKSKGKSIQINKRNSNLEELDTYVHEAIHACTWDMDEEAVTEMGKDIAKFLWRLGYRKTK